MGYLVAMETIICYVIFLAMNYFLQYRDTNEKYEKYVMTSKYIIKYDKYVIKYGKYVMISKRYGKYGMISKRYGITSKCMS